MIRRILVLGRRGGCSSTTRITLQQYQQYQCQYQQQHNQPQQKAWRNYSGIIDRRRMHRLFLMDSQQYHQHLYQHPQYHHHHHPQQIQKRGILSQALQNRLETMKARHQEILQEISSSSSSSGSLSKELAMLSRPMNLVHERDELQDDYQQLQELLVEAQHSKDVEMEHDCQQEIQRIQETLEGLEQKLVDALLPHDEEDFDSDAIIEVRAGTGGDEASLFALELFEAYSKLAKLMGFKPEILDASYSEIRGLKEGSLLIKGGATFPMPSIIQSDNDDDDNTNKDDTTTPQSVQQDNDVLLFAPYGTFKFESGVHRVQRVPVNDTRIHTSACSVAVMPSVKESASSKDLLPMSELRIDTMRSSGAGGQSVNTTDSAVRITHIPTGIVASIQDERSQHSNKEKALKLVTARVRDMQRLAQLKERGERRSQLMGGGDRSERIRTYNYAQDRITDHRCKGSRHGIQGLLGGNRSEVHNLVATFLPHLFLMQRQELLETMEQQQHKQDKKQDKK